MIITHFLYCPFTGLGLRGGYRGDEWLRNRIKVFKNFVLPSLLSQTNKEFILWISWRAEDAMNPIVKQFADNLTEIRDIKVVHTFHGVCFWDDKYPDDAAAKILRNALDKSMPELAPHVADSGVVLMTIQPSDDMYLPDMVEETQQYFRIYNYKDRTQVMGFRKGYIMNYATKEIAEYNPATSPPFYTISFASDIFLDPDAHMKYTGPYKSHEYVKDFLEQKVLPQRGYVVGTHGENISTTWNHPYKGRMLSKDEAEKVLIGCGVYWSDPVIVNRKARLLVRGILNKVPFQNKLRETYHNLPTSWQIF